MHPAPPLPRRPRPADGPGGPRTPSPARRLLAPAALALLLPLVASCGGEGDLPPPSGPVVGQEIWITYYSPEHQAYGVRTGRPRKEAEELAQSLRARVAAGEDIGPLARKYSNAPGGSADGFSGLLPADPANPSPRDRALAAVRVGEMTPVLDWLGGFWFARRVDLGKAAELERLFDRMQRLRTKFRAIALLYQDAWIADAEAAEKVRLTKAQAVSLAEGLLARARGGEDFETLARQYSNDAPSADRGGLVLIPGPDGQPTEWIPRVPRSSRQVMIPDPVLEAAFATPPGQVHPAVVVTAVGVFVVKVEARREE